MATLTLVPFTPAHFTTLVGWFDDEAAVVAWGGPDVRFPLDDAQLAAMLAEGDGAQPRRRCWTATGAGGEMVGHIQLGYHWRHGVARIGRVAIAPERRGFGLGVPLLRAVLERAWSSPEIERVELAVYTWNAPAIATYERVGFRREGVGRSVVRIGAERWDVLSMGLLRSDLEPTSAPGAKMGDAGDSEPTSS